MKKQRKNSLRFCSLISGRLILLAMMLLIGRGVGYSQEILTVTSSADDGPGSLRQTVADAVDGDVVNFDGAITTITLESTLNLGDKTLTIDGKDAVVLHREIADTDTFRLVTITGVPDKEVTITNLTIQNGFANDVPNTDEGNGGGLYANNSAGGKTILENVTFKNNTADKSGGGAYTQGLDEYSNIVSNCKFIENKALHVSEGRGGGLFPLYTTVTGSTFTGNECGDSGGAIMSGNNVTIEDCVFTGNAALDDSGGAIRIQGNNSWVRNSKFDSNSAGRVGGAVMLAKGDAFDCEFINNSSIGGGGGVFSNNVTNVYNCVFTGNSTAASGGGIYMDDNAVIQNCIITGNNAGTVGGGVHLAGNKGAATLVGSIVANNTADSIGGGIYVGVAKMINNVITKNYAAENGGALSGDGDWFLVNSIVYDNDAAGDYKNIQFISNSATDHAANSAIDVTAYDPSVWTATNITPLDESPFVGGSGADSLKLADASPLIDAGTTDFGVAELLPETDMNGVKRIINDAIDVGAYEHLQSFIVTTDADEGEGSLRQIIADAVDGESIVTFADDITTIKVDTTLELGDKTLIINGGGDVILDGAFNGDVALDTNRVITVTGVAEKVVTIKNLTIQNGFAQDGEGGGLYADHSAGGKSILEGIIFKDNTSNNHGGGVSITGNTEDFSIITNCEFTGNKTSGNSDGGGIIADNVEIHNSTFTGNEAGDDGGALWMRKVLVYDSHFSENVATTSGGAVRIQDVSGTLTNCTFDGNSAGSTAGAVMMARGSIYNSEFTNNTSVDNGGAILANQDECIIDSCTFTGNSSANNGGAAWIDDGGKMTNCIIINNTAANMGGGVYLLGAKAPALLVGSVVANNTADVQGGGLYVVKANVINTIITENYAGTNGGAMTGDGAWFLANSIVFGNDAAGDNKNIEIISNSATDQAANSAIDATAYNADAWTATDIIVLDESPFVGGSGTDSLYSRPSSGLIDAGTLEFGIADLLPETDIEGDYRIQGNIDMGAYETEVISVLSITLNRTSLQIGVDETRTLEATVEPDHATDKSVTWSSSDESVATVVDGVVTGVSDGSATITATTVDGGYTATCNVTVRVAVTGVALNEEAITLKEGETFTLQATLIPENASNQMVGWVSGDEDVATVDDGLVTAISPGTTTISVVTLDGSFIASCEVTVETATSIGAINAAMFNVYPNPVQNNLMIEGKSIQSVAIYSITGHPVKVVEEGLSEGINVSALSSGIYLLKITTNKGTAVKTIIKE